MLIDAPDQPGRFLWGYRMISQRCGCPSNKALPTSTLSLAPKEFTDKLLGLVMVWLTCHRSHRGPLRRSNFAPVPTLFGAAMVAGKETGGCDFGPGTFGEYLPM